MRTIHAIGICVVLGAFGAGAALADDLNPPPWRTSPPGVPPTTYQAWEFSTPANPSLADVDLNAFGDPLATVVYHKPVAPWIPYDQGHQGVWYVEDWLELWIPNRPDPNMYKLVWLQLTFYADGSGDPQIFSVPPWASVQTISKVPLDPWYSHGTYLITIQPNPPEEILYLLPRDCTIYVDEIVVDTICIPEPTTGAFVLLSALGLARRRR